MLIEQRKSKKNLKLGHMQTFGTRTSEMRAAVSLTLLIFVVKIKRTT